MIILLSNSPNFVLKRALHKHQIQSWAYLGKNYHRAVRFRKIFGPKRPEQDFSKKIYTVSDEKRKDFVRWIDDISFANKTSKEWLFSVSAVKNPYSSDLFLTYVYYFVIMRCMQEGNAPDLLLVDSPALAKTLMRIFPGQAQLTGSNRIMAVIFSGYNCVRSVYRYIKYSFEMMIKRLSVSLVLKGHGKQLLADTDNPMFIRSYITGDFSDSDTDTSERHYFPGLNDYLNKNDHSPVFLPFTVRVTSFVQLFTKIKNSKKKIVLPEEFFNFSDYGYALGAPFRALVYRINIMATEGVDLSALIQEDYYNGIADFQLMYASLLSRFGSRLKKMEFKCPAIINWAENQSIEKGILCGLRESFPEMKLITSQSFVFPPNHLSIFPSRQDYSILGLAPNKTLVLGPIWKRSLNEYIDDQNIDFSPSFRYTNLLKDAPLNSYGNNILILLGYGYANVIYTLEMLLDLPEQIAKCDNVYIKLHPHFHLNEKDIIKELKRPLPSNFSFVEGQLEDYLDKVALGICVATGTAIELVVRGVPVIVIGAHQGLTMNYLSYRTDPDLWALCFSREEIKEAMNRFLGRIASESVNLRERAGEFKRAFFAGSEEKYWENYLIKNEVDDQQHL